MYKFGSARPNGMRATANRLRTPGPSASASCPCKRNDVPVRRYGTRSEQYMAIVCGGPGGSAVQRPDRARAIGRWGGEQPRLLEPRIAPRCRDLHSDPDNRAGRHHDWGDIVEIEFLSGHDRSEGVPDRSIDA